MGYIPWIKDSHTIASNNNKWVFLLILDSGLFFALIMIVTPLPSYTYGAVLSMYLIFVRYSTFIILLLRAWDLWLLWKVIHHGWRASNKKGSPTRLRAVSIQFGTTRLIWGLGLYFQSQITQINHL